MHKHDSVCTSHSFNEQLIPFQITLIILIIWIYLNLPLSAIRDHEMLSVINRISSWKMDLFPGILKYRVICLPRFYYSRQLMQRIK